MVHKILLILGLSGVLLAHIGSAAPSRPLAPDKRTGAYLPLQKRQGDPTLNTQAGADYALPPPEDVFKYLANPAAYPPTDILLPTTAGSEPGEGIEGSSVPHKLPPTPLEPPGSFTQTPTTTKLVIVGAVMAGIVGFIICAYFILDWPMFKCCRRKKKPTPDNILGKDAGNSEKSLSSTPNSSVIINVNGSPQDQHLENVLLPPTQSTLGHSLQLHQAKLNQYQVTDIGPPPPPKLQSFISASEYSNALSSMRPYSSALTSQGTASARSSSFAPSFLGTASARASTVSPSNASATERNSSGTVISQSISAPLLPPHEFFCTPPSPKDPYLQHTKARSPPLFGHAPTRKYPASPEAPGKRRAGDHRKSKSISGLVYVVHAEGS